MVRQLTTAAFSAMTNGRHLAADLRTIRDTWNHQVSARPDSAVWRVADLVIRRPVVDAQVVAREVGIAMTNVYRHLDLLVRVGVLVEFTDRKRHRVWRSAEVLAALDAFAARAGRRRQPDG